MSKLPTAIEIVKGEITEANKYDFIPEKGDIIKVDGEKYITITVNKKMMHFIMEGLSKYKTAFTSDSTSDIEERDQVNKLIDEFSDINDVLNEEVIVKVVGKQEPNPVEDVEGIPNDPT